MTGHVFERTNRGQGHSYQLDGKRIPGVTTALNALAKPALINWAANMAANYAVDNWDDLAAVTPSTRLARISKAHRTRNQAAMVRGTRIHTFGAALLDGYPQDVPDELAGPVTAYARFLDTWQLRPLHTELPVCHTEWLYAGTLDAIAISPKLGTVLFDIKTGNVYRETALQLAAYRYCNLTGQPGVAMPKVDATYVAHVMTDSVELVPVTADKDTWAAFLNILAAWKWQEWADLDSPVGRAVHPEDV